MNWVELKRLLRFASVGLGAAFVHYIIVVLLVEFSSLQPLSSNIIGFLLAFIFSYSGHKFWTFADYVKLKEEQQTTNRKNNQSLIRFFAVAILSFSVNQALFALLLIYTAIPYYISLASVILLVAMMTYILSKLWAFKI